MNSPPILEPILVVGLGCSRGLTDLAFDPCPYEVRSAFQRSMTDGPLGRDVDTRGSGHGTRIVPCPLEATLADAVAHRLNGYTGQN